MGMTAEQVAETETHALAKLRHALETRGYTVGDIDPPVVPVPLPAEVADAIADAEVVE